jgi:phosphate transport system substrate-binding protein
LAAAFLAVGCGGPPVASNAPVSGRLAIVSVADAIPFMEEMLATFARGRPGLQIDLTAGTTSEAVNSLAAGAVAGAVTTTPGGMPASWQQTEIARQPIAVIVNSEQRLPGLSLDDLAGIYSGRISDWSQLGSTAMPIMVLSREPTAPARGRLEAALFGPDDRLTPNALLLPSDDAMIATVTRRPEAIGFVAGAAGAAGVRLLAINGEQPAAAARGRPYPLWQPIILMTRGPLSSDMAAFVSYVKSKQGQHAIMLWGYGQGMNSP